MENPSHPDTLRDKAGEDETPTAYDRAQHLLVCSALNVSPDPSAPGDTAYEAVNRMLEEVSRL